MVNWNKRIRKAREVRDEKTTKSGDSISNTRPISSTRTTMYLIGIFAGIISLPFILLFASGYNIHVTFGDAISTSFTQIFSTVHLVELSFISIGLGLTTFSAALLYELKFSDELIGRIKNKWYWKKFFYHFDLRDKRHVWHLVLGYFITISLLTPPVGRDILFTQSSVQNLTLYQAEILAVMIVPLGLLIGRILSKIDIKIVDTNMGFFVVVLYLGLVMYVIMANGAIPFIHYFGMFSNYGLHESVPEGKAAEGGFMAYMSTAIEAGIITLADVIVIKKVFRKPL